ncbi:dTDP-4-amino-4,6-dideoxy-D-glucose aminotransferase VioA [Pseudomonas sp. NPDC007930]|uniref:dTDP-4-amino-4,6-dideoxy-D-glucose aminotransferase VioA n=1 Tax=Pseudomonas sp. NPDC007930 TaxID=3364417 RepID=UPI0036E9095D
MSKVIPVTSPLLPPLEEFMPYLQKIWDSRRLTNGGPFHQQLEAALADYLGVEHLCLFANGTLALLTALQTLRVSGEVITTPYSFVATSHALLWNNLKPVFVDIDPVTCNLDPARIEEAITPNTSAILPVHCYGNPCDVEAIGSIADTYGLNVIYDAAHCFGVRHRGMSVLRHGDLSILSFHATKVFNTFEGGAIVCPDLKTKKRIDYLKNFGFANEVTVVAPGINGKMSEINAAFGLLQLQHIDAALEQRQRIDEAYRQRLEGIPGLRLGALQAGQDANYSYFPIYIENGFGASRDAVYELMREHDILARRYFYPLISEFPMYRGLESSAAGRLPVASRISSQVLCLPIYPGLPEEVIDSVCRLLETAAGTTAQLSA